MSRPHPRDLIWLIYRTEAKSYNNRAAAYTKLMALPEALKDADQAIAIDPKFIKAYIRKALTQQAMKEHTAAMATLQKATELDTEKKVKLLSVYKSKLTRSAYPRIGEQHVYDHDGDAAATSGGDR